MGSLLHCWKCHKQISKEPIRIGFRATCPHCDIDLHVCKNCRYYSIGKPNDCLVPGTEFVKDREASNLCEEFKPKTGFEKDRDALEKAKRLLGDNQETKKRHWNDLFGE